MSKTIRKLFLLKKSNLYYAFLAVFVSAIAVAHFVLQMSFITNKTPRSVETAIENAPPREPIINIEPERNELEKVEAVQSPKVVQTVSHRRKETAPAQLQNRKKIVRENKVERLRRTERILTGI